VEHLDPAQLLRLVDDLLDWAGRYFASLTAVAGGAYKAEIQLGTFYQAHIAPHIGGSHLALLVGLDEPSAPPPHAVESLDWSYPTFGERPHRAGTEPPRTAGALRQRREDAEFAAREVLGSTGRRRRSFDQRLALAQHLGPVRETQARELTLPWPVLRRALARLGTAARSAGAIETTDDVFYLQHRELARCVGGHSTGSLASKVAERRAAVAAAAQLKPPLFTGDLPRFFERINRGTLERLGMEPTAEAVLTGVAVSPGIASGPVRIVLDAGGFDDVRPGDVLVAPTTAPAWNPLFARAAAVITDGGNLFSHASVVAREYGIPAVVGCGDATGRLSAGQHVTVDGTKGTVTLVR
jgi:pyruvate,water dikinase